MNYQPAKGDESRDLLSMFLLICGYLNIGDFMEEVRQDISSGVCNISEEITNVSN